MLQKSDNPWDQQFVLPLLVKPSNDPNRPLCEAAGQIAPGGSGEEQPPAETPLLLSGEDYQWMLLL
jgi:hypothetical protein